MDEVKAAIIKAQYEDTKQLVERGVIDSRKLCRDRVHTWVREHATWNEVNEWFDANHPEIPSGRNH